MSPGQYFPSLQAVHFPELMYCPAGHETEYSLVQKLIMVWIIQKNTCRWIADLCLDTRVE